MTPCVPVLPNLHQQLLDGPRSGAAPLARGIMSALPVAQQCGTVAPHCGRLYAQLASQRMRGGVTSSRYAWCIYSLHRTAPGPDTVNHRASVIRQALGKAEGGDKANNAAHPLPASYTSHCMPLLIVASVRLV